MRLRIILANSVALVGCALVSGVSPDESSAIYRSAPEKVLSNIGLTSFNVKWTGYGAYLHRMIAAVQANWDQILAKSGKEPPSGTRVSVKFRMSSKGEVIEIMDVEGTSDALGEKACASSVTRAAPYGTWTDEMIADLGTSQVLILVFAYP